VISYAWGLGCTMNIYAEVIYLCMGLKFINYELHREIIKRGDCWVCVIFFRADIFSPSQHIFGTTYFRDDIFSGPHDIRWFLGTWFFCRWFSIFG
jgi:hypothetical protein